MTIFHLGCFKSVLIWTENAMSKPDNRVDCREKKLLNIGRGRSLVWVGIIWLQLEGPVGMREWLYYEWEKIGYNTEVCLKEEPMIYKLLLQTLNYLYHLSHIALWPFMFKNFAESNSPNIGNDLEILLLNSYSD